MHHFFDRPPYCRFPILDKASSIHDTAYMATTTVSTRIEEDELRVLNSLVESSGYDRSTLVKMLLRRGMKALRLESAVDACRREKITLSRAAEMAGISTWDFVALMDNEELELHYGADEFEADLNLTL
jgi:predicted HTH domain antitoxin